MMTSGPLEMCLFDLAERFFAVSATLRDMLGVDDPAGRAAAAASARRVFADMDGVLATEPYLGTGTGGGDFGGADLAFAALAAPLLLPPQYSGGALARVPTLSDFVTAEDDEYAVLVRELRTTRAGKHALRCYEEYRYVAAAPPPAEADKSD